MAEAGHDVAGERLVRSLRQVDAGDGAHLVEVEQAVGLDLAAVVAQRVVALDVVLVPDVADHLLDEVLERDDACCAAVLVNDDGEVVPLAAHLRHGRQDLLAVRQRLDLAHHVRDPHAAGAGGRDHQVAHVQEADDVVLRAAGHRVARVRRLRGLLDRPAQRHAGLEEGDLGARQHHLAQLALPRREDVVDELALVLGQRLVGRDQTAQLVLADGLALAVRVAPEQAHHDVGALGQQPDDRPEQHRDPVEQRREQQRDPLGALQREPLGGQLAEDEGEVADDEGDQDQRDGVGRALGKTGVGQQAGDGHREPGSTEGGRQEARQGDPDLHGRQEAVGAREQPGDPGAPLALVGQRLGLRLAQGDQGELGGGEDAAHQDEHGDQHQVQDGHVHGAHHPRGEAARAGVLGGSTPTSLEDVHPTRARTRRGPR